MDLEKPARLAHLEHDTKEHALMLARARRPSAVCEASGVPLRLLRVMGLRLDVDRIDSSQGYVRGNMQLLASSLNRAKWRDLDVPEKDIEGLRMLAVEAAALVAERARTAELVGF